jgi:hypothetical protein
VRRYHLLQPPAGKLTRTSTQKFVKPASFRSHEKSQVYEKVIKEKETPVLS